MYVIQLSKFLRYLSRLVYTFIILLLLQFLLFIYLVVGNCCYVVVLFVDVICWWWFCCCFIVVHLCCLSLRIISHTIIAYVHTYFILYKSFLNTLTKFAVQSLQSMLWKRKTVSERLMHNNDNNNDKDNMHNRVVGMPQMEFSVEIRKNNSQIENIINQNGNSMIN